MTDQPSSSAFDVDADGPDEIDLSIEILDPRSGSAQLLTVPVNIPGGGVTFVITAKPTDDGHGLRLGFVIGGGPEASVEGLEDAADFLREMSDFIGSPEAKEGWAAKVAAAREQEWEPEPGTDDFGM